MADLKDLEAIVKRIETVTERLESAAKGEVTEEISNIGDNVRAFDDIYGGTFKTFFTLSHELGSPEVSSIADLFDKALKAQREFLLIASRSKRPEDQNLAILIKPTGDLIKQIQDYREGQRTSPYFHHLSAVASSAPALGWVVVSPAPAPFLKEIANAGEFYTNRVLREWKEKRTGTQHMEWVQALFWFHNELQDYVKQFHTTGLVWNQTGGDAMQMAVSNGKAAPPPPSAPLPPPPPPSAPPSAPLPPPPPPPRTTSKPPAADARDELMGKINSGEDVVKDLKKVSDEEKNHKNPALRSDGLVKAKNVAPAAKKAEAKPPKKELDGRKWNIEFFLDDPSIIVEETDSSQSVYVYKCEGSTIQVKGKVNNIVLDQCKKTGLLFESVISSIEVINCRSVQMQALGAVPSISVDKTDGCQIYLSAESTRVEIVTSTSSEMNVLIPGEDGFVERPIPEQFSSRIKDGVLVTVPTSHEIDLE